jgi:hypothetical protein
VADNNIDASCDGGVIPDISAQPRFSNLPKIAGGQQFSSVIRHIHAVSFVIPVNEVVEHDH